MKKLLSIVMCAVLLISVIATFAGCGEEATTTNQNTTTGKATQLETTATNDAETTTKVPVSEQGDTTAMLTTTTTKKNDTTNKPSVHSHKYNVVDSKNATCTDAGYKIYRCNCGDEYTDNLSSLGHKYSDATCTSAKKCSRCGETEGSSLGHTGGSSCLRCGKVLFETITISGSNNTLQRYKYNLNLPEGNYRFTLYCYGGSSGNSATASYYSNDGSRISLTRPETHPNGGPVNGLLAYVGRTEDISTTVIKGPVENCYIEIFTYKGGQWKLVIEAI